MKRHITRFLLLLTILTTCKLSLKAQDFLPFVNDNYAGISGVHFQPASIADSRLKFDLTLVGLSLNLSNNYAYLNKSYIPELWKNPDFDMSKLYGLRPHDGTDRFIYQDTRLDLMNFMFTINPRLSIGFTAGIREVLNVDNFPDAFIQIMEEGRNDGVILPWHQMLHEEDMRINMNSWAEYGISVAGVVYKSNHHVVKAGMNVKILEGLASAYLNVNEADFLLYNNDSVYIDNSTVYYGISDGLGRLADGSFEETSITRRRGVGLDFGIVWEWRPNYENYLYDMDGKTNLERRDQDKYLLKVGLSVRDLGAVKFKKSPYSQDFVANGYFNGHMFEDFESLEDISDFISTSGRITPIESEEIYKMSLPTTISLQVDYNIYKDFYINFTPNIALRQGHDTYAKIHSYSNYSLTPRYETAMFGASLPIQYSTIYGFTAGAGLRLGPIWIGSNNILSTLAKPELDKINVQMLVKIPIPHTKVKDKDGDKVSNKKDQCKKVPGVWENFGCPYDDDDEDGIPNDEDKCPDVYGKAELNGCPDSDNDGITDAEDECPNMPGLAIFNGCPDHDGDSIPDHLDACPTIAGLVIFEGCPDTDGDSIPDHLDNCPNMAGSLEMNGCPDADTDNDGIKDADDKCPTMAGPAEFGGCPDSDGDGLPDHEDQCPNIAGPIEFDGCPDSDNDSIPDHKDQCPSIAGPVEFEGCPDSDNDNIPDHLDDCPLVKGIAEFNGCPDTDGDGVMDKYDKCPEEPGAIENDGCPIYVPVEFATNIGFESGKATLTKESYPYLDQLVDLMNEDDRCWVKLDGHTDNTGSDKINQKLSQDRVDAIRDYLIEKGINPNRIIAKGHGSSQPIADNKTAEGRAKNRRVEINIAH